MPEANVGPIPDGADPGSVTLTIPAACADSFRREVWLNLKGAADQLVEGAKWFLDQSDLNRLDQRDRPNLTAAERLFDAIRDQRGDLTATAGSDLLTALVRLAVSNAAEDLASDLDAAASTTNDMRALLAPLACWCDVIDRHAWLAAAWTPARTEAKGDR